MSRDCFRCVFIVNFDISQMLAEAITQSASCFTDVYFSTLGAGYAVDKISQSSREMKKLAAKAV